MSFDLSPWRGQTVQLYFNVYNDGVGGTAAMFLDDVSLTACTGGVTLVPTGGVTLVPTGGVTLIPSGTPSPTPTPSGTPAPVCVDAIVNGDFTGGLTSWQPVGDLAGIAVITNPVHSTPYRGSIGFPDAEPQRPGNDTPTGDDPHRVLAGHARRLGVHAGPVRHRRRLPGDRPAGTRPAPRSFARLWAGRQNNPAWQQLLFDVSSFAGQTIFVSFSVNNDGAGGRTAMVVDDVRLQSCNATPGPVTTPTRTPTPDPCDTVGRRLLGPVTAIPPIITLHTRPARLR